MKYAYMAIMLPVCLLGAVLISRSVTLESLNNQNTIFDGFEKTQSLWLFSDRIGSASASGLERARVAIGGPLGLSSQEAVYFISIEDMQGQPLVSDCDYEVSGGAIDARWWSITLYDSDTQHYVPNAQKRSSWNSLSVPQGDDGNWAFTVSQMRQDGPWLPSQAEPGRRFELNLRVYNPSPDLRAAIPNIPLPRVERLSC